MLTLCQVLSTRILLEKKKYPPPRPAPALLYASAVHPLSLRKTHSDFCFTFDRNLSTPVTEAEGCQTFKGILNYVVSSSFSKGHRGPTSKPGGWSDISSF